MKTVILEHGCKLRPNDLAQPVHIGEGFRLDDLVTALQGGSRPLRRLLTQTISPYLEEHLRLWPEAKLAEARSPKSLLFHATTEDPAPDADDDCQLQWWVLCVEMANGSGSEQMTRIAGCSLHHLAGSTFRINDRLEWALDPMKLKSPTKRSLSKLRLPRLTLMQLLRTLFQEMDYFGSPANVASLSAKLGQADADGPWHELTLPMAGDD